MATIEVKVPDIGDFKDVPVIERDGEAGRHGGGRRPAGRARVRQGDDGGALARGRQGRGDQDRRGRQGLRGRADRCCSRAAQAAAERRGRIVRRRRRPLRPRRGRGRGTRRGEGARHRRLQGRAGHRGPGEGRRHRAKDDPLVELESDKATMEVPSPAGGTVKEIKVKEGDKVSEGSLILLLATAAGSAARRVRRRRPRRRSRPPPPRPARRPTGGRRRGCRRRGRRRRAARLALGARFARELGVDLAKVKGSGRKGRILREDVTGYFKSAQRARAGRGGGAVGRHGHPADPEGRLLEVRPGRGRRAAADQEDLRPGPAPLLAERPARHPQRRGGHHRDRGVPQGARHQGQGGRATG